MILRFNKDGENRQRGLPKVWILTLDSVIYKLFFRAFPNHFQGNSIYAHYPMTIPRYILAALKGPSVAYSWKRKQKDHAQSWT